MKSEKITGKKLGDTVTTLRVVWIEIGLSVSEMNSSEVTTLRVVWIEILLGYNNISVYKVTTLRVVWIEMAIQLLPIVNRVLSPPCGWCGLKYNLCEEKVIVYLSPPCGWCGLKYGKRIL